MASKIVSPSEHEVESAKVLARRDALQLAEMRTALSREYAAIEQWWPDNKDGRHLKDMLTRLEIKINALCRETEKLENLIDSTSLTPEIS